MIKQIETKLELLKKDYATSKFKYEEASKKPLTYGLQKLIEVLETDMQILNAQITILVEVLKDSEDYAND